MDLGWWKSRLARREKDNTSSSIIDKAEEAAVSDASRAIQSMILTAWSEGIASNWAGF